MVDLKFICNEPALVYGRALVVADLHLGVERSLFGEMIEVDFFGRVKDRLLKLVDENGCEEVVVVGDVKHDVPTMRAPEREKLRKFVEEVRGKVKVSIVMGNHDGGIMREVKGVDVYGASGMRRGEVAFVHGHAWPSERMMGAEWLVVAHNHPCVEFVDRVGYRRVEKVWVVGRIDKGRVGRKYKKFNKEMRFVLMPAFSELIGGMVLNSKKRKLLGPLFRNEMFKLDEAETFLLNGINIGKLSEIEEVER